jgi:ADP-ribosylglycohydrolase
METVDRYTGALLGLAAGDALGTAVEFSPPGSFAPVTDIIGGGPFNLLPGQWTDDTSMALCLADSLVETGTFDPIDQLERYSRWYRQGYLSSNGRCFDIGNATRQALARFARTRQPNCGTQDGFTAGNGSLMRVAPVPLAYARQPALAIEKCAESSLTTHGLRVTADACRYFGALILGALSGENKETLLSPLYTPVVGYWTRIPLHREIEEVGRGTFKTKQPPEITGNGYVVSNLEAALWAFYRGLDYREGALLAVNLGDDADTTGAIYGQLAGAYYGVEAIPVGWLDKLAKRELIENFARKLYKLSLTI